MQGNVYTLMPDFMLKSTSYTTHNPCTRIWYMISAKDPKVLDIRSLADKLLLDTHSSVIIKKWGESDKKRIKINIKYKGGGAS